MKLKTWIAIGSVAFATWRGYRKMKKSARRNAKSARKALMRARGA